MRSGPPSRRKSHSTGTNPPIAKFLGAHHVFKKDGNITTLTVEMEDFMKDAAAIYTTEIRATKLAEARTPYLPENTWDFAPK